MKRGNSEDLKDISVVNQVAYLFCQGKFVHFKRYN